MDPSNDRSCRPDIPPPDLKELQKIAFAVGLQQTSNMHDAEEIAQDSILILLKRACNRSRSPIRNHRKYISGIAWRVSMKKLGRKYRSSRLTQSLGTIDPRDVNTKTTLDLMIAAASEDEIKLRVHQVLSRLNKRDRQVITLRIFKSLSNKQIAATLQLTPSGAVNRYARALARFLDYWKEIANSD